MMVPLFATLLLLLVVVLFGTVMAVLPGKLFGPKVKKDAVKQATYECGVPEQLTGHSKVPVKFYLTAILFILFDIEIIFMYPWAVTFLDFAEAGHGLYIFGAIGVFLAIFIYGLFWEIKSKALEWE